MTIPPSPHQMHETHERYERDQHISERAWNAAYAAGAASQAERIGRMEELIARLAKFNPELLYDDAGGCDLTLDELIEDAKAALKDPQ